MTATTPVDVIRQLLNTHASTREVEDSPVPDDVLADLLRLTQCAPTAFNTQPYVAIIVRKSEDKEAARVGDADDQPGQGTEQGAMAWAYKQTTFAAAAFLYAAAAHGLGTCPMEGFDHDAVKAAVGLPDRYAVPIVISFGYPKQGVAPRRSNRLEPTAVFFEGRFGEPTNELFTTNGSSFRSCVQGYILERPLQ